MRYLVLCLSCLLGFSSAVVAQSLTILTEDDPPAQYLDANGELAGFTVELVREIQKRVGNNDKIQVVPWARAYRMIETEPNVVVFLMSRTAERNELFNWVGPVMETEFGLYAQAKSTLRLASLEEAKAVKRIGVYRGDVRDQILSNAGFTNLERTYTIVQNVKMLMAGRIDLYAGSSSGYGLDAERAGYKASDLKLVLPFHKSQLYIAMSRQMPMASVDKWNDSVGAIRG